MIINVSQALLDLIKQLETRELAEQSNLSFAWSYYEDGLGASGEAWVNHPHAEYQLFVRDDGTPSVMFRELGKYDNEGWETHPLDSYYEEDEE